MPVHHRGTDRPLGFLLESCAGQLDIGDSIELTPRAESADLLERCLGLNGLGLRVWLPQPGEPAVPDFSGYIVTWPLPAEFVQVMAARHSHFLDPEMEVPWLPSHVFEVRYQVALVPGACLELHFEVRVDSNPHETFFAPREGPSRWEFRHAPWLWVNWWATPKKVELPFVFGG